tara:strand:+ start:4340 stop:5011 length:672 start_codon:yes stop_codon:yes gene_type:complete
MPYLGKSGSQAFRNRFYYTASGSETSVSGADDNGNTLTYADGEYVDVSKNGISLVAGSDYNTDTANTIGGLSALAASDIIEVVVYGRFNVFSNVVSGTFSNVTLSGTTTTSGTVVGQTLVQTGVSGAQTLDFATYQNFVLTISNTVSLANPTTETVGQSGFITIIQPSTGTPKTSFQTGTDFETPDNGAEIILTDQLGATDVISYIVIASNRILLTTPLRNFV